MGKIRAAWLAPVEARQVAGAQDSRTAAQREVKVVKHERVELGDLCESASKLSRGQRPSALSRRQYNPLHTLSRVGRGHADPMETPRRELVSHLYHAALERPATERSRFLNDACKGDLALQQELESLLRYDSGSARFLESPAADIVANGIPQPASILGRRLGPYQIVALLGSGGMGEVYRGRDLKLGRDVAIKLLPAQFMADQERRARFAREARILAALNHPHIGAIYGLEESDDVTALVLELVEGPTLAERLAQGPLPISETLVIASQIADALDAAHSKGIIHRDLKPSNVILETTTGAAANAMRVRVLDFGIAKLTPTLPGTEATDDPFVSVATADGHILGTPAYMSPEQTRGNPVDKRTDIWAFGCVVFEMLTGHSPFSAQTVSDTLARILEREPEWASLPSATPTGMLTVLRRCLRKDAEKRLRDIGDARIEMADQSQMAEPAYHGVGQHSTASLRADIGFARPVLPTEAINPLSVALDSAPVSEIVEMMASEDSRVVAAVREVKERIEQGVEIITQALGTGGRLIFVGAGTSGRLGALEAAEMPPTFGTLPQTVRAIVPGGQEEVLRYKGQSEAEDRYEDGVRSIARLRVAKADVVVGISASGTTPRRRVVLRGRRHSLRVNRNRCPRQLLLRR